MSSANSEAVATSGDVVFGNKSTMPPWVLAVIVGGALLALVLVAVGRKKKGVK